MSLSSSTRRTIGVGPTRHPTFVSHSNSDSFPFILITSSPPSRLPNKFYTLSFTNITIGRNPRSFNALRSSATAMSLRSILQDGLGSISRRAFESWRKDKRNGSVDLGVGDGLECGDLSDGGGCRSWAGLPSELLREVVRRLEESETAWPGRKSVVACGSVCRSWRAVCKEIVGAPETTGKLTFPVALKQPGPRSGPIQCYIKRNKAASTYQLFLGLDTENGKFLMVARKIRRPTHSEYILSMSVEGVSRNSVTYMGKLRSNFLGTKFAVYDTQPPYSGAVTSSGRSSNWFYSRKVSPKVPSGSYDIAHIAYELNMLGSRGPRRMCCTMHSIPASALEPNGSVHSIYDPQSFDESFSSLSFSRSLMDDSKSIESSRFAGSTRFTEVAVDVVGKDKPLILKNKPPRWHEQLQCWCLNFRGRVTVASVKNFQLIAASGDPVENNTGAGTSQPGSSDHDKIILQFGKIGKDLFTMDYRYPLSAFQAFGICLSSFDTKLACE